MKELEEGIRKRLAVKKAGWGDDAMRGLRNPLSQMNGEYNPYGAALVGGGTGLATYLFSRLLGMKNGPSLIASILGGLGGTHYALGKQYAGKGPYSPLNFAYLNDLLNRIKKVPPVSEEQAAENAANMAASKTDVNMNEVKPTEPDPYEVEIPEEPTRVPAEGDYPAGTVEAPKDTFNDPYESYIPDASKEVEAAVAADRAKRAAIREQQKAEMLRLQRTSGDSATDAKVLDKVVNGMETGANAIKDTAAKGADWLYGTAWPVAAAAVGKGYEGAKGAAKKTWNWMNNTTGHDLFFGKGQPVQQGSSEATKAPAYNATKAPVVEKPNYPALLRKEGIKSDIARGAATAADLASRGLTTGANAISNGAKGVGNFAKDSALGIGDLVGGHLWPELKRGGKEFVNFMNTPLEESFNK